MAVRGASSAVTVKDVLIGEVWLNSGQSNAGFAMAATTGFKQEQPNASHPSMRYFHSWKCNSVLPVADSHGTWRRVTPETVGAMPGQGYYFARKVQSELNVPVGIIEASHGGSALSSWMSEKAIDSSPRFGEMQEHRDRVREQMNRDMPAVIAQVKAWVEQARQNADLARPMPPFPIDRSPLRQFYSYYQSDKDDRYTRLSNTMIHPIAGFGLRGILWNQGEADTGIYAGYRYRKAALVEDWRERWGAELPFYCVQMPLRRESKLPYMWAEQTAAVKMIPNSGMTVSHDISAYGTRAEVHPPNKEDVGERLALLALAKTYGVKDLVYSSPFMKSVNAEGAAAVATFDHVGRGLKTRDGKAPDWWEVAGRDKKTFVRATAVIQNDKVRASADGVDRPTVVRLGWHPHASCNLVNSAGLPAMPFSAEIE